MNDLEILKRRLQKIGIDIELVGNLPWVYLRKINGKVVKAEDYNDNHGYTIAFYNWTIDLTDLKKTFEIIRKYK